MKSLTYIFLAIIAFASTYTQALVTMVDTTQKPTFIYTNEKTLNYAQDASHEYIYLAGKPKSSTKTTTKTKKDGDVVTREVTRTNDGKGNKTTTRTTTTTHPSSDSSSGSGPSHGGVGDSREGY